ncbi:hypothetical protein [Actinacidiphila rubida]|uniref:Uncharacterized protein n=1 Tax=Actinacidiphila rubida TaxID=310780 RepID=A0A1H8P5D6_9ACTN|nr:hypothetical protein [Actinacidiphila rubida]SEO37011.1 hypothetical protein SAMN05216267_1024116 [Actinacidiphila rubida]
MSSTLTAGVNRLRRALGAAVSWHPHAPAAATGPADVDLPLALAAGLPPLRRAAEVRATPAARTPHPSARRRAAAVRR